MSKKIILCDVDLTVVDPIPLWWRWLQIQYGFILDFGYIAGRARLNNEKLPYDVSVLFGDAHKNRGGEELKLDPSDFWRNEGIYDLMIPLPGVVEALRKLSKEYEIRFVSHCKGNHHKSKYEFLKRNFPFMSGFAATKEKYMLHADIFIDDRNDHLNKMPDTVLKLQHKSLYKQDEDLTCGYKDCNWEQIYTIITNYEF